jgi:hypothetical protein
MMSNFWFRGIYKPWQAVFQRVNPMLMIGLI